MGGGSASGVRVVGVWIRCLGGVVNSAGVPLFLSLFLLLPVVMSVARRLLSFGNDMCLVVGGKLVLTGLGVMLSLLLVPVGSFVGELVRLRLAMVVRLCLFFFIVSFLLSYFRY